MSDSFEQPATKLIEFIRDLNRSQDLDQFLSAFVDLACQLTQCEQSLVLLFESETDTLKIVACQPRYKEALKPIRLPLERSLAGKVYYSGRAMILNSKDFSETMDSNPVNLKLEQAFGSHTHNLAVVPMVFRGETVGVVEARNKRGKANFTSDDVKCLETMASLAAVTVLSHVLFEEVEHAYKQVKALGQLRDNFIAISSHELRTPIGLILGHATFLEELIDDPELKYQMNVILRNTSRLKEIVDDLTRVNEYDTGASRLRTKPTSMLRLIQSIAPAFKSRAKRKNIQLSLRLPDNELMVDADEEKISLVINNLLYNALTFTDPGGQILVTAERLPGYVQVNVIDNGVGIPATELHKVFERFFQVQSHLTRKHGGIGLGLSVAKVMVELHKGQIWVESKEGQGSKFTFLLPTQASTMERLQTLQK